MALGSSIHRMDGATAPQLLPLPLLHQLHQLSFKVHIRVDLSSFQVLI